MNGRRPVAAHGLALALGLSLASVAAGQTGPVDATRAARPLSWATVFATPSWSTPVGPTRLAVREGLGTGLGDGRDPAAPPTVAVDARPPPPSTVEPTRSATPTGDASLSVEAPARSSAIFFDVVGGAERRVRPTEDTDRAFAVGTPLVALKAGVARRYRNHWELAGAVGATISLVTDEQRVNRSSFFAEAEVNRYLARGVFIGTGLSLWDLTQSDMWTPAWLLHFGIPLSRSARYAVSFIGEGRLFFTRIDDVTNNCEVWGGVQVRLRR